MKSPCLAGALVLAHACLAIAQVADLQIKITEGDEAVHFTGSRSAQPITVQIADESGHTIPGAAVSFRLPDEGPGAMFETGLRTEIVISDEHGQATVRHLQFNSIAGDFQIRVVAAKDQARGAALVRQSIRPALQAKPKPARKWVMMGLLVAGVAGGVGAGVAARPSSPAPRTAPVPETTVGPPSVSVGR